MSELTRGCYGLLVRFDVIEGHEEAFDALTAETLRAIRVDEPGTLIYLAHLDAGSPSVRVFYELYRDVAAFEAHEATSHVRRFLSERTAHLRGEPEVWRVAPKAGVIREGVQLEGD